MVTSTESEAVIVVGLHDCESAFIFKKRFRMHAPRLVYQILQLTNWSPDATAVRSWLMSSMSIIIDASELQETSEIFGIGSKNMTVCCTSETWCHDVVNRHNVCKRQSAATADCVGTYP